MTHEQTQQVNQKPNITFEQNEALKERTTSQVELMGQNVVIRKEACPECRSKGYDEKGDNLVRYSDNSAYCFACQYSERGEGRYNGEKRVTHEQTQQVNQKPNITFEQNEALKV